MSEVVLGTNLVQGGRRALMLHSLIHRVLIFYEAQGGLLFLKADASHLVSINADSHLKMILARQNAVPLAAINTLNNDTNIFFIRGGNDLSYNRDASYAADVLDVRLLCDRVTLGGKEDISVALNSGIYRLDRGRAADVKVHYHIWKYNHLAHNEHG